MVWSWLWLGIVLLAVILEAITDKKTFFWFIPAAFISAAIDFITDSIVAQLIVFVAVSLVGIFVLRRFIPVILANAKKSYDIDTIVGERCTVIDKIDTFAGRGHARVKGQVYAARGLYDDDVFEVGETLLIVAIEGVKLVCKKVN